MRQHEPQSARNGRKTLEAREERVQSDAVILSKKKKSATIQKVVRTRALTGPPENTSGQVFKMVEIPSKKRKSASSPVNTTLPETKISSVKRTGDAIR